MKLRKTEVSEHQKTRTLWEKIFTEDTEQFLDYYYAVKAQHNEIFVVEDGETTAAMLHLNPYSVRIGEYVHSVQYIVAVATDERYRRRGLMASLLKAAMRERYCRREPFVFLMPAAEAIYYPFDFRFVYRRGQSKVFGNERAAENLEIVPVLKKDCSRTAQFANQFLEKYEIVTERDFQYYEMLTVEQESENGAVMAVKKQNRLVGIFCYAKEEGWEIREPLFFEREDLEGAVFQLTKNEQEAVHCIGYGDEQKIPMIMARILHLETFLSCFSVKEEIDFFVRIQDGIIEENAGVFHIMGNTRQGIVLTEKCGDCAAVCGEISIGTLTSILFGYKTVEETASEPEEHLSEDLRKELAKIKPLSKVFLNEIV